MHANIEVFLKRFPIDDSLFTKTLFAPAIFLAGSFACIRGSIFQNAKTWRYCTSNPENFPVGSSHSIDIPVTMAERGPVRASDISCSKTSFEPSATISTSPFGRLLTEPRRARALAFVWMK